MAGYTPQQAYDAAMRTMTPVAYLAIACESYYERCAEQDRLVETQEDTSAWRAMFRTSDAWIQFWEAVLALLEVNHGLTGEALDCQRA